MNTSLVLGVIIGLVASLILDRLAFWLMPSDQEHTDAPSDKR